MSLERTKMTICNLLGVAALVALTAVPSLSAAQRGGRPYGYGRSSYGHGPFYPSQIPSPSYRYFGTGRPYRAGGATFYFGPGGGYYGSYGGFYGQPYAPRFRGTYRGYGNGYVPRRHWR